MNTSKSISYSDGSVVLNPIVQIWGDLNTERRGDWFRAFWCASPEVATGSPVIGYCSPGGSQRAIKTVVREVLSHYPDAVIYLNGRPVKKG